MSQVNIQDVGVRRRVLILDRDAYVERIGRRHTARVEEVRVLPVADAPVLVAHLQDVCAAVATNKDPVCPALEDLHVADGVRTEKA